MTRVPPAVFSTFARVRAFLASRDTNDCDVKIQSKRGCGKGAVIRAVPDSEIT